MKFAPFAKPAALLAALAASLACLAGCTPASQKDEGRVVASGKDALAESRQKEMDRIKSDTHMPPNVKKAALAEIERQEKAAQASAQARAQ